MYKAKTIDARKIVFIGLFVALGVLLPMFFHFFNMGGPAFLPMHIPVLIGAALLGPEAGIFIGALTPVLSSALTSMPPVYPMLPIMLFELLAYGFVMGLMVRKGTNIYLSLIVSMLVGRLVAGLVVFVLNTGFKFEGFKVLPYLQGAVVTGLPGIILQLVFVPVIVKMLKDRIRFDG